MSLFYLSFCVVAVLVIARIGISYLRAIERLGFNLAGVILLSALFFATPARMALRVELGVYELAEAD